MSADPTRVRSNPRRGDHPPAGVVRALAVVAAMLAVAYFAWRGVWRGASNSGDLAVGYAAGRAWLSGHDPYDVGTLVAEISRAGGADQAGNLLDRLRNVYFPTTLPVFALIGGLAWPQARLVVLTLNVAATLFVALGVTSLAGWRIASARGVALIALILALAPFHTTIAFGQTGILATAAVVAAVLAERARHPLLAGFAFGLATLIKVQIGLPFLLYLLWRRRWAMPLVAGLTIVATTAVSVIRMEAAGVSWMRGWLANVHVLSGPGGLNDPGVLNADRFSLLDLQYPLRSIVDDGRLAFATTLTLIGSAAIAFIWLRRGRDPSPDLLALAFVSVLGLLVMYHRYYDAVLLALPIAWACSALGSPRRIQGILVLLLSADFLLPLQSIFHHGIPTGILPAWLTGGTFWTSFVLGQHVWALALMAITMIYAAHREQMELIVPTASVAAVRQH